MSWVLKSLLAIKFWEFRVIGSRLIYDWVLIKKSKSHRRIKYPPYTPPKIRFKTF